MNYSEKVMDHFYNPRNVGEIANPSGVGSVGNPTCGDIMKLYIKVDEHGIITDAKFRTFGCASATTTAQPTSGKQGRSLTSFPRYTT